MDLGETRNMNKDYTVYFKEEYSSVGVYLIPHGVKITEKSLFIIKIGFLDLDEDPLVFHCIDSDRMTIDVMESIVYSWRQWKKDSDKAPI